MEIKNLFGLYFANPKGTKIISSGIGVAAATNAAAVSNDISIEVTVEEPVYTNLITNGSFDDSSGWTIINIDPTDNGIGSVTIADGVVTFAETQSPSEWKHWAVYTQLTLEPGIYQFDMDMTYTDINDVWGEVYIGLVLLDSRSV